MKLSAFQARLSALAGITKYAAAFGLGALMTLAMPPVGAFYVLLACVPGFIWLARAAETRRAAFFTGWAFGAGYFIFGLYWISVALFVDIASFWWVLPFSAIAGPAALALYYGFIPLLARHFRKHEAAHAFAMVAAWAFIEWVRGHALTGFPWNLPGYAWHHFPPVMQVSAAFGIYGLTLLTLLWAAIPALPRKMACFVLLSFVIAAGAGMARLSLHPAAEGGPVVRLVQPDIQQSLKWDRAALENNFRNYLELTSGPAAHPVSFVVWPETSVIADARDFAASASRIAASLPPGSMGLLGVLRIEGEQFYNSLIALDGHGQVRGVYNKHHLVPFGEYIPYRQYLNLTPVASGIAMIGDFTRGDGLATLSLGERLPRPSPLVCYEAIFPGEVAARGSTRPGWLLNVTNDGWYGKTAGPHQHFEISRVRAIEEGLPLVRAANTGISAVIDPLGRIMGKIDLGRRGMADIALPAPLLPTLYSEFRDFLFFLMLAALTALGGISRYRK